MNPKNTFCRKCKLYTKVKSPCIEGRGDLSAPVLILGETMGKTEDELGNVFVGKSGQFLQPYLNALGFTYFISNAQLCRSTDAEGNNKTPVAKHLDYCKASTIDLILRMKPKVIITLGKIALQQLVKLGTGIEVIHGKVLYHPELELYIVPTYHPAFILRNQDQQYAREFKNDLEQAFILSTAPARRRIISTPTTISDTVEINKYLLKLKDVPAFVVDLETTGLNPRKDRITDISLCSEAGKGVHIEWDYISESLEHINLLKEILLSPNSEKVFQNGSFDISFLRAVGFDVKPPLFDTMLAYHTLTMSFEGGKATSLYKLKTMAWFLTQEGGYDDVLSKFGGIVGVQKQLDEDILLEDEIEEEEESLFTKQELMVAEGLDVELEDRLNYAYSYIDNKREQLLKDLKLSPKEYYSAMDADVTFRIYKNLKLKIDEQYKDVFYNIVMPTCITLMRIEENGIRINSSYIDKLIEENSIKAEEIRQAVVTKAGYDFNINSSDQVSYYMYKHLKLPPNQKFLTKKGRKPAADEKAIKFFSETYPELQDILKYRSITKETSTYLVGYKDLADENSRVYPSYNQIGTATSRTSCIAEGTQITLLGEYTNIENVRVGDVAYCYDDAGKVRLSKIKRVIDNGMRECIKLKWQSSGTRRAGELIVTPDHLLKRQRGKWVRADTIKKRDLLNSCVVTSVKSAGIHHVYDLEIEEYHNFIANGICVHNCSSPNLQNVPKDNRIRNMVIPRKGYKLLLCDLSQIELRILAQLANDTNMIRAFESGYDFHTYTACSMFNISIDKFDKKNSAEHASSRDAAKTINFGIIYGQGASALAESLKISLQKAEAFMHQFFGSYPKVPEWISYIRSFAYQYGYVETLYGRRRYLPNIYSSINSIRAEAERMASNTPIQGSSSDVFVIGMNRYQDWIDENRLDISIVGTVHDSILSEVPYDLVDMVIPKLHDLVTKDIPRITIELKADIVALDKWVK